MAGVSDPTRRRRPSVAAAVVLAAALIAAAAGAWWWARPRAPDAAAAAKLVRAHNAAVGRLEANDPVDAGRLLADLLAAGDGLPASLGVAAAAVRNRAVAAVLAVDAESGAAVPPADRAALMPAAGAAVRALLESEPADPAGSYLEARFAAASGDDARRRDALVAAAGAAPDAAWPRLALFDAFADSRDPALAAAAAAALAEASRLAPENVWVLLNYAKVAAANERPETAAVFAALRERLAPYETGFAYRQAGGVLPLVDAGRAAAAAGEWPAARRNAGLLFNVVRSEEVARADRLDLERHPLDFIRTDFPPAFYEAAGLARAPDPAAVPVRFVPFAGGLAPPEVAGVRDAAAVNFDLLGGLELVLLTADAVRVYSRDAGGPWAETVVYELPAGADYAGLRAVDFDLDSDAAPRDAPGRAGPAVGCHKADPDVLLFGPGGVVVLRNDLNPDGSRVLVPVDAGLDGAGAVTNAAAADLDQEGDLDLVLIGENGVSLWFNRGNVTFEDRSARSDLRVPAGFAATDLIPVDYDRDVDLDVLVGSAGAGGPAAILENLRHGEFRLRSAGGGPVGLEVLDADGNASWDLVTAAAGAAGPGLTLTPSVTPAPGRVAWGERRRIRLMRTPNRVRAFDYDNDGRTDLAAWDDADAERPEVWLLRGVGPGGGGFETINPNPLPTPAAPVTELAPHDFDGDGDLDLLGLAGGRVRLWENRGGEANASLRVALLAEFDKDGTDPKRTNHAGLGSLLELRRGPVYQSAVVRDRVTHFGLGPRSRLDGGNEAGEVLRVLWPNGIPEVVLNPESGAVCHPQKLGGSCPYLYVWDGERFAFATDLCWAAPVGLQLAEGAFAPTRAWEHVKLPGELLTARDGTLDLRITCELWEADYFDRVELTCVDHPAGTHVFTNEKVGPPELVEPTIYAAADLFAPAAARARSGGEDWRDVLETVRERDEDYLKPFGRTVTQGYTEPWELELDLAGAPRAGAVLLLTGWVFPTDTGLNVALSQNPDLPGPRPPQLLMETPDGWAAALPNAGFPGGRRRRSPCPCRTSPRNIGKSGWRGRRNSIGTGPRGACRGAWACGRPPRRWPPRSCGTAGFPRRGWPGSGHGPDRFDYDTVSTAPAWPAMAGPFTRYGDVRALLTAADDRQAVLGSGDELALRFTAPPPPPAGWVRDYVVSSVGYDKDANLHTAHGQGILPLPHAGMSRYPPAPDEPFPATPALREYLETYQTRTAADRRFWRAVRDGATTPPWTP